jgi:chaperone required for assembly of F1-ATPase
MKRFYKNATVEMGDDRFRVLLDGKPVRTPGGNLLAVPAGALAEAIAKEWEAQGDEIVPTSMPMLRLANTALDGIPQNQEAVIEAILRFGGHELLCYRADDVVLAARQASLWSPLLDWAAARFGVTLQVGTGVVHVEQPPEALAKLRAALAAYDDCALAALHVMASITGSLILALAMAEGRIEAGEGFRLSRIDEDYQAEKWGQDAEAESRARGLAQELETAAAFLAASRD